MEKHDKTINNVHFNILGGRNGGDQTIEEYICVRIDGVKKLASQ